MTESTTTEEQVDAIMQSLVGQYPRGFGWLQIVEPSAARKRMRENLSCGVHSMGRDDCPRCCRTWVAGDHFLADVANGHGPNVCVRCAEGWLAEYWVCGRRTIEEDAIVGGGEETTSEGGGGGEESGRESGEETGEETGEEEGEETGNTSPEVPLPAPLAAPEQLEPAALLDPARAVALLPELDPELLALVDAMELLDDQSAEGQPVDCCDICGCALPIMLGLTTEPVCSGCAELVSSITKTGSVECRA